MSEENKTNEKSRISPILIVGGIVFLGIILLGAIYQSDGNNGSSDADLVDTVWIAYSLNGKDILPETTVSAQFNDDGVVNGSSGCNSYSATYDVNRNEISFGEEIAMTRKLCPDLINAQERAYIEALGEVTRFEIEDDTLTLMDDDDNELVVFEAQSQELEGSSWDVTSYNNSIGGVTSVIIGTEMTAIFSEDGQLSGSSGCNTYSAPYSDDDESISIELPAVTLRFCAEPEGIMEQESKYLTALQTAATYRIEGDVMTMHTKDGATVANFSRTSE